MAGERQADISNPSLSTAQGGIDEIVERQGEMRDAERRAPSGEQRAEPVDATEEDAGAGTT